MSENHEKKNYVENDPNNNDLRAYLEEMEHLESDFSDLDDLDVEELQEMQEAIAQVREEVYGDGEEVLEKDKVYLKEEIVEIAKPEEIQGPSEVENKARSSPEISSELEERIKLELLKKKEIEDKKIVTPEKFLDYIKNKRDKIWYHSLHYLVYNVEDHIASKALLYDVLKEVTSKNAIDPLPEHQFYFGLGYILRLSIENKKIIRYMSGGKFKINVSIKTLKEILEQVGEPISLRPVIEEDEKKKMFKDFLNDDFLDI